MADTISLFANPGQTINLAVQVTDGYGSRVDGYVPQIISVYQPDSSPASGFPLTMSRLDTGLYYGQVSIGTGSSALGTFIASVYYLDPSSNPVWQIFEINVALPFGNSSFSPL